MAAPNLRIPSAITGKTAPSLVGTSNAAVLTNAAASGKVLKVTAIRGANISAATSALSVSHYRSTTHRYLVKGSAVEVGEALVVSDRNDYIYLEEGDALYAQASVASSFDLIIAYEDIS
jgi:hypothetical protein